jgi:hypothetical protein
MVTFITLYVSRSKFFKELDLHNIDARMQHPKNSLGDSRERSNSVKDPKLHGTGEEGSIDSSFH